MNLDDAKDAIGDWLEAILPGVTIVDAQAISAADGGAILPPEPYASIDVVPSGAPGGDGEYVGAAANELRGVRVVTATVRIQGAQADAILETVRTMARRGHSDRLRAGGVGFNEELSAIDSSEFQQTGFAIRAEWSGAFSYASVREVPLEYIDTMEVEHVDAPEGLDDGPATFDLGG